MEITREIVEYIRKNNISAAEISENTKVDLDLLLGNADRKMNAGARCRHRTRQWYGRC